MSTTISRNSACSAVSVSVSSCAIVASSSSSLSSIGSSGSCVACVLGCVLELAVDLSYWFVRGSLCTCVSDVSLLPDLTDVRLSPLGESMCGVLFVAVVALFVESVESTGDIVDLCDSMLCCVDGACLDLERLDVVVIGDARPCGAGGGGGPLSVDMGVTILVAVDIVSVVSFVNVASSSSIGIGVAGVGASGGLRA